MTVYLLFAALLVFYLPHGTILFSFRHHCGGRLTKRQPTAPSSLDLLQKKVERTRLAACFIYIRAMILRTYQSSIDTYVNTRAYLFPLYLLLPFSSLSSTLMPSLPLCQPCLCLFPSASSWCLSPQSFLQSFFQKRLL